MTVRVTDTATKNNKSLGMLALYFLLRPRGSLKSSSVLDMPACGVHIRQHDFNRAVSIRGSLRRGCLLQGLRVSRSSSWQEEMEKQKKEEEMLT